MHGIVPRVREPLPGWPGWGLRASRGLRFLLRVLTVGETHASIDTAEVVARHDRTRWARLQYDVQEVGDFVKVTQRVVQGGVCRAQPLQNGTSHPQCGLALPPLPLPEPTTRGADGGPCCPRWTPPRTLCRPLHHPRHSPTAAHARSRARRPQGVITGIQLLVTGELETGSFQGCPATAATTGWSSAPCKEPF